MATLALFLIMIVTVVDVFARSLLGRSVPGMIESAEVILVAAAFLGLGYAQRMKAHVSTAVFVQAMPPQVARGIRLASTAALAVCIAATAWVSAQRAWGAWRAGEVRFGLVEIPQWPARAAIAIGFVLLLLEVLRDLRALVDGGRDRPERDL